MEPAPKKLLAQARTELVERVRDAIRLACRRTTVQVLCRQSREFLLAFAPRSPHANQQLAQLV